MIESIDDARDRVMRNGDHNACTRCGDDLMMKRRRKYLIAWIALLAITALLPLAILLWRSPPGLIVTVLVGLAFLAAAVIAILGFDALIRSLASLVWPTAVMHPDHRGRPAELREWAELPTRFTLSTELRDRFRRWTRTHHPPAWLAVVLALPFLLLLEIGVLWYLRIPLPVWAQWGLVGLPALVLFTLAPRTVKVITLRWQCAFLINVGRCPSCGYELRALPPADDGCTVCPECGAAWRLPEEHPAEPGDVE